MLNKFRYLEIRSHEDDRVVKRVDVTAKIENHEQTRKVPNEKEKAL